MCIYIHTHTYIRYVYLSISEMNDSNDIRDRKEELGVFCYFKVLTLLKKWYSFFESRLELVVNVYSKF